MMYYYVICAVVAVCYVFPAASKPTGLKAWLSDSDRQHIDEVQLNNSSALAKIGKHSRHANGPVIHPTIQHLLDPLKTQRGPTGNKLSFNQQERRELVSTINLLRREGVPEKADPRKNALFVVWNSTLEIAARATVMKCEFLKTMAIDQSGFMLPPKCGYNTAELMYVISLKLTSRAVNTVSFGCALKFCADGFPDVGEPFNKSATSQLCTFWRPEGYYDDTPVNMTLPPNYEAQKCNVVTECKVVDQEHCLCDETFYDQQLAGTMPDQSGGSTSTISPPNLVFMYSLLITGVFFILRV